MTKADHVVFHPQKPNTAYCRHCGATQAIPVPCSANVFAAVTKAFTEDHLNCKQSPSVAAADTVAMVASFSSPKAWLDGWDTGASSKTIWFCLYRGGPGMCPSIPMDPSDFGRCLRLVRAFGWRSRLDEVTALVPAWGPFVTAWDELAALYDEELPTGAAPRCYERMREIGREAEAIKDGGLR
jgi:hypothetical protein